MSLPYSAPGTTARTRALQLVAVALLLACDRVPTAPREQAQKEPETETPAPTAEKPQLFSDRARVLDPEKTTLVSTPDDHASGRYRFRFAASAKVPSLERDDFIVAHADSPVVRMVLSTRRVGDELVLETGPAYWHDVIRGGTYGITMPIDANATEAMTFDGQIAKLILPPVTVGSAPISLGSLSHEFQKTDVCVWAEERRGAPVCGKEMEQELGWLTIAGTLDTLLIHGGSVGVTGDMDVALTVSPGGIEGGTPPVFAPCNRGAYLGCITTPTGAALIEWLRYYVPAIPEASLPPVRLCIPGTPVRVKAGYWNTSGFIPFWVPPVFEQCRVTSNGVLPTIVLPSFSNAVAHLRPRIAGSMLVQVKGDGKIGLEIPIPSLGIGRAYTIGNDFKAEAKLGLFVGLEMDVKNTGGLFLLHFENAGVATHQWTPTAGWTNGWESTKSEKGLQVLAIDRPDSIVFRVSLPLQASAGLCLAIISCDVDEPSLKSLTVADSPPAKALDIAISVEAEIKGYPLIDATFTRETVNADPFVDNVKIALEGAWAIDLKAGIKIPLTGFILPSVPRKFERTFECCRVSMGDLWMQGKLEVRTSTTGTAPDPDGYSIHVERADTLPPIIKEGAQRMPATVPFDHGRPMDTTIASLDTVVLSRGYPCAVFYSDGAIFGLGPVWGGIVQGLRASGVGIPNYAAPYPCDLLVARYNVSLSGVSENCTVTGGPSKTVWLQSRDHVLLRSDTAVTTFDVVCNGTNPLGALSITTAGASALTARPYQILLDGVEIATMNPGATRTFTSLRAGARVLSVTGGPLGCIAPGPRDITVVASDTITENIAPLTCVGFDTQPVPGEVTVGTPVTGAGTDPDGFQVKLDGVQRASSTANGSAKVTDVPGNTPSVLHLSGIAGNCRTTVPSPRTFALNSTASPISISMPLSCTDAPIDSVAGVVETSSGLVSIRLATGALLGVTGVLRPEVAQLAGVPVQMWGVRTGTSLDVYGYQLQSTIVTPRWTGIVTIRGTDVWLFGEEAIRLIAPPAAITANAGALLWVGGTPESTGVRPTVFGLIRSAP